MADGPSDFTNTTWVTMGPGTEWCAENPTVTACWEWYPHVPSNYHYEINLGANVALAVIFGLSLVGFIVTWAATRRATAFCVTLSLGLVCEVFGYIGRIMGYENPWDDMGFMIQICCLTIGPAFMAAGLYLCLRRIVVLYGEDNSAIKAMNYTRIFVPCDIISLILQFSGGMLAAGSDDPDMTQMGVDLMIAGLGVQVATSIGFLAAYLHFTLRMRSRVKLMGDEALEQDPDLVATRSSMYFKLFRVAHLVSTFMILLRSCYRLAEMASGRGSWLQSQQNLYIALEGGLIVVAVLVLNFFHPAIAMKAVFYIPEEPREKKGFFARFRKEKEEPVKWGDDD